MFLYFILLQTEIITQAATATDNSLFNYMLAALTSAICTLTGAIIYLYKSKMKQDSEHKADMRELYDKMNNLMVKALETMTITNERLNHLK